MNKLNHLSNKFVARNSHRPEIKLSQSVMVGRLAVLSYTTSTRGSIAQSGIFINTGFLPLSLHSPKSLWDKGDTANKNNYRLFSTFPSCLLSKQSSKDLKYNTTNIIRRWDISSIDNLVFHEDYDTAIVVLPPLYDIMKINISDKDNLWKNDELKNAIVISDFYNDLVKIVGDLRIGNYNFYLHIYSEYSGLLMESVFNFDQDNKKILSEMRAYHGYIKYSGFSLDKHFTSSSQRDHGVLGFIFNLIYGIYKNIELNQNSLYKINNYNYNQETLIFIQKNYPFLQEKRKLINSSMNIYMDYKKPTPSKSSLITNNSPVLLPNNPNAKYTSIQAIVIKDRNPIGKFKPTPGAKGIVTVFITVEGIFQNILQHWYGEYTRNTEIRSAFISHLDINVLYSVSLMVRKGKHNVSLVYPTGRFNRDIFVKNFDEFLSWLKSEIVNLQSVDVKRYRDRLISTDYVKIIFKPVSDINIDQDVNQPLTTNRNLSSLGQNSNNSNGSVNPIIPIDNSDSYLVENHNSYLSIQNANTSLPTSYKDLLEYHKGLMMEIDITISKINNNSQLYNINKKYEGIPFKYLYEGYDEKSLIRSIGKLKNKAQILAKTSGVRINIRKYSTYINNTQKGLFSTSSSAFLGSQSIIPLSPVGDSGDTRSAHSVVKKNFFCDWFRGFTDAEGSFNITRKRDKFYSFSFEIKLHIDDISVLNYIQVSLQGIGKVYKSLSSPTCKFIISKQDDVKKIIEIFSNNSLNSSKNLNFLAWAEAFNLYTGGKGKESTDPLHPSSLMEIGQAKSQSLALRGISVKNNSKELIFKRIEALKAGMNTKRTVWNCNNTADINITPNWLLGYVEGDGSFFVAKEKNFTLFFSIAQKTVDLPLMEAIKNYLNGLNSHFNDGVYLTTYKSKTNERSDMVNLTATKSEFISQVIIPLFQNLRWGTKKELDFLDWISVLKIKQLGIHHTEEGVGMIQRIIGQMNNNRLSTSPSSAAAVVAAEDDHTPFSLIPRREIRGCSHEDRNTLLLDLKTMLGVGSNYIINDKGQTIIKSSGKFLKKGSAIMILILDGEGNTLNEFKSINACASFLGISHDTVRARLRSGKSIKFNSNLVYVKKKDTLGNFL